MDQKFGVIGLGRFGRSIARKLAAKGAEVMGIDKSFELAFWKAETAAGQVLPTEGCVFLSAKDRDKNWIIEVAKELDTMNFELVATEGTAAAIENAGLQVKRTCKLAEEGTNVIDLMKFSRLIAKNSNTQVIVVKNELELKNYFEKNLISDEIIIGMGAGKISQWMRELKLTL